MASLLSYLGYLFGIAFIVLLLLKLFKVGKIAWSWVWTPLIIAVAIYLIQRFLM